MLKEFVLDVITLMVVVIVAMWIYDNYIRIDLAPKKR